MERIKMEDLRYLLEELNELTSEDNYPYVFYKAYGSIALCKIVNDGGGERTIFNLTTKKDLYYQMRAFISGIYAEKERNEK